MKSDHRLGRCFLAGLLGDEINAVLAAAGMNFRKLLRAFVLALVSWLSQAARPTPNVRHCATPTPITA